MRLLFRQRRRIAWGAASLAVAVLAIEVGLRLVQGWMVSYYGLDRRFEDPDAFRILFVGDSFTAGGGTESGKGYPEYLEASLNGRERKDRRVEVVNIALSGTDTEIHRRRLERYLRDPANRPDLVFIVTGVNNFTAKETRQAYCRDPGGRVRTGPWDRLRYGSMILSFVESVLLGGHGFGPESHADPFSSEHFSGYVRDRFEEALKGIVGSLRKEGIAVVLGTYIRPSELDRRNLEVLRDVSRCFDVPLIDIYSEALDRRFLEDGLYTRDRWHPNDAGQRFLASIYRLALTKAGILEDMGTERVGSTTAEAP